MCLTYVCICIHIKEFYKSEIYNQYKIYIQILIAGKSYYLKTTDTHKAFTCANAWYTY